MVSTDQQPIQPPPFHHPIHPGSDHHILRPAAGPSASHFPRPCPGRACTQPASAASARATAGVCCTGCAHADAAGRRADHTHRFTDRSTLAPRSVPRRPATDPWEMRQQLPLLPYTELPPAMCAFLFLAWLATTHPPGTRGGGLWWRGGVVADRYLVCISKQIIHKAPADVDFFAWLPVGLIV